MLSVSGGGLVNGKWYTTGRLRTKSFLLWHARTHAVHPPSICARTLTPSRSSWVHFNLWQGARGSFISFRREHKWHETSHKSSDRLTSHCHVLFWKSIQRRLYFRALCLKLVSNHPLHSQDIYTPQLGDKYKLPTFGCGRGYHLNTTGLSHWCEKSSYKKLRRKEEFNSPIKCFPVLH